MLNRQQRRQLIRGTKRRGVGFTRQFSSARVRRKHGTVCLGQVEDPSTLNEFWQNVAGYTPPSETPTLDLVEAEQSEEAEAPSYQTLVDSLMAHNAHTIVAEIKTGKYDEALDLIREVEEAGKNRKTVLAAIEARQ